MRVGRRAYVENILIKIEMVVKSDADDFDMARGTTIDECSHRWSPELSETNHCLILQIMH